MASFQLSRKNRGKITARNYTSHHIQCYTQYYLYSVTLLHNLSLKQHCHLPVCTVLTKYTKVCLLSYLRLILSTV